MFKKILSSIFIFTAIFSQSSHADLSNLIVNTGIEAGYKYAVTSDHIITFRGGELIIFDKKSKKKISSHNITPRKEFTKFLKFSGKGSYLYDYQGKEHIVWDVKTGKILNINLDRQIRIARIVYFTPDESHYLITDGDSKLSLYNTKTGKKIWGKELKSDTGFSDIAFTGKNTFYTPYWSANKNKSYIYEYDLITGKRKKTINLYNNNVNIKYGGDLKIYTLNKSNKVLISRFSERYIVNTDTNDIKYLSVNAFWGDNGLYLLNNSSDSFYVTRFGRDISFAGGDKRIISNIDLCKSGISSLLKDGDTIMFRCKNNNNLFLLKADKIESEYIELLGLINRTKSGKATLKEIKDVITKTLATKNKYYIEKGSSLITYALEAVKNENENEIGKDLYREIMEVSELDHLKKYTSEIKLALKNAFETEIEYYKKADHFVFTAIKYNEIISKKRFNETIRAAAKIDLALLESEEGKDNIKSIIDKYSLLSDKDKIDSEGFAKIIEIADNKLLKNKGLKIEESIENYYILNKVFYEPYYAPIINKSIFEKLGFDLRHTFREGRIGERYVPEITNSYAESNSRYINGNRITETEFKDYTAGGYNESRYGFHAVYQLHNNSDKTYVLDILIEASAHFTEKVVNKSSWSGKKSHGEESKIKKIKEYKTIVLKSKDEYKNQLSVGEKYPDNFKISIKKISIVDDKWIKDLSESIEGTVLKKSLHMLNDERAKSWHPDIIANFARQAYMNIGLSIEAGDRFDKDFISPVEIKVINNNKEEIKFLFDTDFSDKSHEIVLKPGEAKIIKDNALGVKKEDLKLIPKLLLPHSETEIIEKIK